MKKFLSLVLLLTALTFTGCGQTEKEEETSNLAPGNFEVTGGYQLYEKSVGDYWKQDKKDRICFDFPQQFLQGGNKEFVETVESRQEFCFTNTGEAKKMLKIPVEGNRGSGTFIVKDVTKRNVLEKKDDTCHKTKSCLYNEAKLVKVVDIETEQYWKDRQAKLREERAKEEVKNIGGSDELESDVAQ